MRNHTPQTLYNLIQSLNPGVPVASMSKGPAAERIDIHRWLNRLDDAGMTDVPFTDPMWMGHEITFHFRDASFIHIKF